MKMNANVRFGLYVLWVTVSFATLAVSFFTEFPPFIFLLLFPSIKRILGPDYKGWYESDREVSNRALIIGFLICLVAVWVGGITLAHYISPQRQTPKYIIWAAAAVLWAAYVLPGYRWWRAQKAEVSA